MLQQPLSFPLLQRTEALPQCQRLIPLQQWDAGRSEARGGDAEWARGGRRLRSPNPDCIPPWYEAALVPPAGCTHPSPSYPHPHPIPIPTKSSLQVTSLTPPAVSLHIAAFHLWQLIAQCWGKGTYAKAAHLRCLLTNHITCPPSKRKGLIYGQGGTRISPLSPCYRGCFCLCGLQEAAP